MYRIVLNLWTCLFPNNSDILRPRGMFGVNIATHHVCEETCPTTTKPSSSIIKIIDTHIRSYYTCLQFHHDPTSLLTQSFLIIVPGSPFEIKLLPPSPSCGKMILKSKENADDMRHEQRIKTKPYNLGFWKGVDIGVLTTEQTFRGLATSVGFSQKEKNANWQSQKGRLQDPSETRQVNSWRLNVSSQAINHLFWWTYMYSYIYIYDNPSLDRQAVYIWSVWCFFFWI